MERIKKYLPYVGLLLLGIVIGWLCREHRYNDAETAQRDTIIRYEKILYSKLELAEQTIRLDVPKIKRSWVFMPTDSTTIIYRDNVQYVTMPREYFYTKTNDVEIWHSGIDSTIDSLNVVRETKEITITTREKPKKNVLAVGMEANYYGSFYAPLYLEYERRFKPWFSLYARAGYNFPTLEYGVGLGVRMQIEW